MIDINEPPEYVCELASWVQLSGSTLLSGTVLFITAGKVATASLAVPPQAKSNQKDVCMAAQRSHAKLKGLAVLLWYSCGCVVGMAQAADPDPLALLKSMSDYVSAQNSISAVVDTDIEVITSELQKIQFASTSRLQLSRPDKLRVERRGGYADIDLQFDGKALMVTDKQASTYAQIDLPGTTDQLIERLRTEYSVDAPGADLLLSESFGVLTDDVVDAKYIGEGVINGIDCDHLAIRDRETDWQIWIERGEKPIPRKYVITSKAVTGAPQYTLIVREWITAPLAADVFAFKVPPNSEKVTVKDLSNFDEVPPGIVAGEKQ